MRTLGALSVALAALLVAAPAIAADLVVDVPAVDEVVPAGFDWEGAYVGGHLGWAGFPAYYAGGEIGYNFLPAESFLLGIEGSGYLLSGGGAELFVNGKAGFVADSVAIYGLAGLGYATAGGIGLWDVGAGIEVAVTDSVTVYGQAKLNQAIGNIPNVPFLQAGVRFHF